MTLSSSQAHKELQLFEFAPGKKTSWSMLRKVIPDVETALFFAKAYEMDYNALSELLLGVFENNSVLEALLTGDHSTSLQSYIIDTVPTDVYKTYTENRTFVDNGHVILPHIWEDIEIVVADSIKEVADTLADVVGAMPGMEGQIAFQHLMKMNKQRGTIGTFSATVHHDRVQNNLVILDDSGSMSEATIRAIMEDVVALSWKANASLALVSNTTRLWEPGTYTVDEVLAAAEYSGTHYETLAPLFNKGQQWGTVISIADYDSSWGAKDAIERTGGSIEKVIDVSLVNQPTFLAECLGTIANAVEPVLIGRSNYPM